MNRIISELEDLGVIFLAAGGRVAYKAIKPKHISKKKAVEEWEEQVGALLEKVSEREGEAFACLKADERRILNAARRFSELEHANKC